MTNKMTFSQGKMGILCCKYDLVWDTENIIVFAPAFFNLNIAAILENIHWAISPEP
jgi:hypothetical protein